MAEYIVAHYRYAEERLGLRAVRSEKIDLLPPTVYRCISRIEAPNGREAIRIFKREVCRSRHERSLQ